MNDQISRQKLIEDVEYLISHTSEGYKEHYAYKIFKELVESQPPADQWIPCSSGNMPKFADQCLITVHRNTVYLIAKGTYWRKFWWIKGEKISLDEVTAWMPLPEPYKGVE